MEENISTQLTDDQIEDIAQQLDDLIKDTPLEDIANLPSNNGQEETNPEDREEGEHKMMNIEIDPSTGEHKITGDVEGLDDNETFEEMCERIANSDINLEESAPITEKELTDYISNSDAESSIIKEISSDFDLSPSAIKDLLSLVNRKMKNEEFNVYKSYPEEIRNMIDKYISSMQIQINSPQGKQFRNMVSEQLINEFITNINIDRISSDFNKEIEELFSKGTKEIADSIVGYTEERNKKYREYADKMEDEDKKEKVNKILDQIDEAYNLSELKEYAKKCKIKKFDLEKPGKIYRDLLNKYKDSNYNIYDINLTEPILYRNLNTDKEEYSIIDIRAFLLAFCRQTMNMKPDDVLEHAYMYYVIYNIILMDMNKGESKEVSDKFIVNIKEVIDNLRIRNNNFL